MSPGSPDDPSLVKQQTISSTDFVLSEAPYQKTSRLPRRFRALSRQDHHEPSARGQRYRTRKSSRRDTSNRLDRKIGAIPDLAPSANVAPVPVSSASPSTGGGYQPAAIPHIGHSSPNSQLGRKRNASIAELDSSPGSQESPERDGTGVDNDGKRHPVKRACNECRQQKLRCDVKQDPVFHACSRCNRLQLLCKIDDTFKRVGKRSRNAEMEREIQELRRQVVEANKNKRPTTNTMAYDQTQWANTDPAVAGLMDLRSGNGIDSNQRSSPNGAAVRRLEEVVLTANRIDELFELFFSFYHPFLPFLNPDRRPDEYFQRSSLLFWTIIAVAARHYKKDRIHTALAAPVMRLAWQTLAEVPQNYHVVKALCLLCTWPFSTSSTSTDPTFMLCGAMMHIALQIGLHRPSHSQDFTKFKLDLREAEVADRVRTWATCNIVAQRVATAYGQPVNTIYDWTLSDEAAKQYENHVLPSGIYNRLQIEMFVDKVSKTLYINHHDSVGIGADHERSTYVSFLTEDYNRLKQNIASDPTPVTQLYLRAAYLHLRLCVFFSPPDLPSYQSDLLELYNATTSFLELCLSLDSQAGVTMSSTWSTGLQIIYGSNYIFQMMLAAGFSLLKLNHTFLRHHGLDTEGASQLFTRTTWALRSMSVADNDLAERLAEVLAQVWRTGRVRAEPNSSNIGEAMADDSLQLKVKCRMSMSHVFDSVWRWRQNFQFKGKSFESYLKNPTDPAAPSANDSSASSTIGGPSASNNTANTNNTDPAIANEVVPGMAGMSTGMGLGNDFETNVGFTNSNVSYEVFDPLNWMLDGLVDFPYNYDAIHSLQNQALE